MASVKDLLLSSLKELVKDDLKKFQWHLVKDLERISKSEMEDADRLKTVDTLVGCFTPEEEAVKITVDILRKMKQNHLAEHLEDEHMQAQMSSGVHTGVSAVINTQKGGTVKFPVVSGNLFPGPVTFNYSTAGHGSSSNDILRWNRSSLKYRSKFEELQKDSSRKKVGNIYFSKSNNYKIGSGGSGTVYLGLKEDGTEVAIKLITKDQQENKYFENELKHLQDLSLENKNIVRSCILRSSGLSIEPLLKCWSCIHIADPDQWVQIEPSVCTDEGGSKFRASTRPGRYECVKTRMRWVCDCDVTLQYQTVDGQFLNAELERLQSNRIAPVMDVTVISGKLEEVHLPHYICLGESEASLRDAVKVLSVEDEGITEEPVQLTRFHAKILQPSFSIKTLIISWIMGWDEHCDLLLYMRYKAPLILHVYLFPFDARAKEEVEKTEKSSYSILHPRPDRPFRMKTPHILDVSGASVHPKEGITLRRETDPNFFKIKTSLENDLQMTLIREEDKKIVWTAITEKDELDQIHPQREESCLKSEADKARYFDEHWPDLVQRVTNVQIIADTLLQQRLIHEEQYSEIKVSLTSQEGMRKICDIVRKHSDAVKAKLISVLQEEKLFHF